jgi:Ca2+-binding EF-hand superfamily protein
MGIQTHSKLIYQVLGELDQDNSGGIDFDEFFKLATSKQPMRETRLDIQRAFNLFDLNREGRITFEELKRVAQDLGEYDNDDQIRKTFKKVLMVTSY